MPTFVVGRLVRDKMVPRLQKETTCTVVFRQLIGDELVKALLMKLDQKITIPDGSVKDEKLIEQVADAKEIVETLIESHDSKPIELAPYQAKINEICEKYALELKEILDKKAWKAERRGLFKDGYYIDEITASPDIPEVYEVLTKENYPIKKE